MISTLTSCLSGQIGDILGKSPLSANEAMPPASESKQEFFAFRGCVETEGFQKRAKNANNRPEGGGIAKVDSPPNGITESNPHSERFRLLNS